MLHRDEIIVTGTDSNQLANKYIIECQVVLNAMKTTKASKRTENRGSSVRNGLFRKVTFDQITQ